MTTAWTPPPAVTPELPDTTDWPARPESDPECWPVVLILDTNTGALTVEYDRGQYPQMRHVPWSYDRRHDGPAAPSGYVFSAGRPVLGWAAEVWAGDRDGLAGLVTRVAPIAQQMLAALRSVPGTDTWDWTRAGAEYEVWLHRCASLSPFLNDATYPHVIDRGWENLTWILDFADLLDRVPAFADPAWAEASDAELDQVALRIWSGSDRRRLLHRVTVEQEFPLPPYVFFAGHDIVGARSALRAWRDAHADKIIPVGEAVPAPGGRVLPCLHHHDGRSGRVRLQVKAPATVVGPMLRDFLAYWVNAEPITGDKSCVCNVAEYDADLLTLHFAKRGYPTQVCAAAV